jgi:NitT/TauT family transport system substrate-binding protein
MKYLYIDSTVEEVVQKISNLKPKTNIVVLSKDSPDELLKTIIGLGYLFNLEKNREYRISIFNPNKEAENLNWKDRKNRFEILNVRQMEHDPFDVIIKKA